MHEEAITKDTKNVLDTISRSGIAKDFYLAGGTALAFYFGHRFSVDLDWFAEKFDYNVLFRQKLENLGKLSIDEGSEKTFNGSLNGVKVSFLEYPYPLVSPKIKYKENVYLAGIPDIAVMKLETVAQRGSYKDFIDIYFLLQKYSLKEMFGFLRKKFININYNETHLLKALTYFEDAKGTPEPKMIQAANWKKVIETIRGEVKNYMKSR